MQTTIRGRLTCFCRVCYVMWYGQKDVMNDICDVWDWSCSCNSVDWFSYWIDTLVSQLREIPTVVVLHHPFFFGETPAQFQAASKGISGAVAGEDQVNVVSRQLANFCRRSQGDIINIYQVPNHKSHLLAIFIIFHLPLIFISLTSKTFLEKYNFLFAFFMFDLLLVCYLCLCYHVPSIWLHLCLLKIYWYGSSSTC